MSERAALLMENLEKPENADLSLTDVCRQMLEEAGLTCTLCEWPSRELLDENANMGVQNNYFVRKRPFWMGRNGGYGFKHSKKK